MWKQILVATANLLYAIAGEQKGTGNTTTSKADWLEKKDRLTQSDRELLNMIEDSYQITLKNRRCTNNCVTGYLNERRNHDQSQRY